MGKTTTGTMDQPQSEKELRERFPNYKGSLTKFDAQKYGTKTKPSDKRDSMTTGKSKKDGNQKKSGPSSPHLPKGSHVDVQQKPTPQKNHNMLEEAIFGFDSCSTEMEPLDTFSVNLCKLITLAQQTFRAMGPDDNQLERKIILEEFCYYCTALLWVRLTDVKCKQQIYALSKEEKALRKAIEEIDFSVPKPIALFLSQVGNIMDKMDKETRLALPDLPTHVIGGMGGYHAGIINRDNHTLIQEVPTMGSAGDVLMALSDADGTKVNWRMRVEDTIDGVKRTGTLQPEHLPNYTGELPTIRMEIKNKLKSYGITAKQFKEYIPGTRFNLPYLLSISAILEKTTTFTIEKVNFTKLTKQGGVTQIMSSIPMAGDSKDWREADVYVTSSSAESAANCGGAIVFGFQLHKDTTQPDNWILAKWKKADEDVMLPKYTANANSRRDMPQGIGTARFRSIGKEQDLMVINVVQKLIKTNR